jgi:dienelactone hydrolase
MTRRLLAPALLWLLVAPGLAQTPPDPPPSRVKADFLALLDRPRVPLDVRLDSPATNEGGLVVERLSFATEKKADGAVERVPALVVRPDKAEEKQPAVLVLHGTGGSKEGVRAWLNDLARRGFVAIAIDARYQGGRAGDAKGAAAYVAAITRAWRTPDGQPHEHPFYYDTCWDIWRTLDYLETRGDVDPQRIGLIGFSMGGIEAWLAGAVDDRVAVAVPAIGVQSFRWSLDNGQWHGRARTVKAAHDAAARDLGEPAVNARVCRALWDKVIPGMLGSFDCPSMIRLFAGRPLLILNGELDPNCPLPGAQLAFRAAESAYEAANAGEKLRIDVARGVGHAVTAPQRRLALEWFERWLKPRS